MCGKKKGKYTTLVSDSFGNGQDKRSYELAFRRWLIRELEEQRMTVLKALERFSFNPTNGRQFIGEWRKKYTP